MSFFEGLIPLTGIVFSIGLPILLVFWIVYTKHRERMRLIEKGLTPDEVKNYFRESERHPKNPFRALKWGILLSFLGMGILTAAILEEKFSLHDGITFGVVLVFTGLGFLLYYTIVKNKIQPEETNNQRISNN